MGKRVFGVTLPIAGHAYIEVEAENQEDAIQEAFNQVEQKHIESWESLEQFNQGNVCYCPHPWEAEAEDLGESDAQRRR